jgi:two-component system sensor histidine kinase VicK
MKIKTLFDKVIKHNLNAAKKLQKKVKITHRFSSEVKELKIDSDILYICFDNLVSNAVKYTPDKDGVVNVKGYFAEKNKVIGGKKITKKSFIFEVSDNGYGIPKQEQSKIFDKLFRATNVQTHDTDGTGLGLYIVKSIVQQAGCDIWFVSAENKGTKFFISVPSTGMKMIKA